MAGLLVVGFLAAAVLAGVGIGAAKAGTAAAASGSCILASPEDPSPDLALGWSDGGVLLLSDGQRLAPEGISLPSRLSGDPALLQAASAAAEGVLAGARVRPGTGRPDRHGRLAADAVLTRAGANDDVAEDLATALLRAGAGTARPVGEPACLAARLAAEAEARQQKRGIWGRPDAVFSATDEAGLSRRTGLFTLAEGRVRDVGVTRDRVYLNFGASWRQDFTVILPKGDFAIILGDGLVPAMLRGTMVQVRGVVRADGGPAIQVRRNGELVRVVDADAAPAARPARRKER